jgi:translation initiation factor 3 subunit K
LHSYQFNPHLARDETITNILVKALTVFPSPDFSLCLSLLPVHTLAPLSSAAHNPAAGDAPLSEAVQKLNELKNLLEGADYAAFWATLDSDDLYADLIADVAGFEELMRVRIAATVSQAVREVDQTILESWLNLSGGDFEHFVGSVCGWAVEDGKVKVPINKDNEAKGTVVRENVKFDRKSSQQNPYTLEGKKKKEKRRVANTSDRVCTRHQEGVRAARMSDLMHETTTRDDGRTAPRVRAREGLGAPCVQFGAAWKNGVGNVVWQQQPAERGRSQPILSRAPTAANGNPTFNEKLVQLACIYPPAKD